MTTQRTGWQFVVMLSLLGIAISGCLPPARWSDSGIPKLVSEQALKTVADDKWRGPNNSSHSAGSPGHGNGKFYKQSMYGTIHGAAEGADQLLEQIRDETLAIIQQRGGVVTGQGERRGDRRQYKSSSVSTSAGDPNDQSTHPLSGFELEYAWKGNYGLIDAHLFEAEDSRVEIVISCSEHRQ